jgi:hypothetical protein
MNGLSENAIFDLYVGIDKRRKEILHIEKDLPPETRRNRKVKYLRRIEDEVVNRFWSAINLYCLGFFEESIIKATLAVEIGFVARLSEQLSDEEKVSINPKRKGTTFGHLIGKAKIDQNLKDLLNKINEVRNCYVHSYNIIAMLKKSVTQQLAEPQRNSESPYAKMVTEMLKIYADLPDFSWCASEKNVKFIDQRMNLYSDSAARYIANLSDEELNKEIAKVDKIGSFWGFFADIFEKFNYTKSDAFDVLNCTHKALKSLGFL